MATSASFNFSEPPINYCPTGPYLKAVVDYLNANGTVTVNEDTSSSFVYFRQSATPTPVANGIWDRIGADGFLNEPLGRYVYFNGRWCPELNNRVGDILWTNFDPNGYIDANGLGLFVPVSPAVDTPNIAGPLFGWCLANGNHGTVNLQTRFPRAGYKYTEGTGWVANVLQSDGTYADSSNGGRPGITLTLPELPALNVAEYVSGGTATAPALYGGTHYTPPTALFNPQNPTGGTQIAIQPIEPLYRTIGAFQYVGYYTASQG